MGYDRFDCICFPTTIAARRCYGEKTLAPNREATARFRWCRWAACQRRVSTRVLMRAPWGCTVSRLSRTTSNFLGSPETVADLLEFEDKSEGTRTTKRLFNGIVSENVYALHHLLYCRLLKAKLFVAKHRRCRGARKSRGFVAVASRRSSFQTPMISSRWQAKQLDYPDY